MAVPLELLITEGPRGGFLVFPWAGTRARTVKFGPVSSGRSPRDLTDGVVDALALDLVNPETGEGEAPDMSTSTVSKVLGHLADGEDALVRFDPKTRRYGVSPMTRFTKMSMRDAASRIVDIDPELAFDLVHLDARGSIEARVAMRWALELMEL